MIKVQFIDGDQVIHTDIAEEKVFRTGSRGYYAGGKLVIGDKRYQLSCSVVEIGSKGTDRSKKS